MAVGCCALCIISHRFFGYVANLLFLIVVIEYIKVNFLLYTNFKEIRK